MKKTIIGMMALCLAAWTLPAQAVEFPEAEFRTTSAYIEQQDVQRGEAVQPFGVYTLAEQMDAKDNVLRTPGQTGSGGNSGTQQPLGDAALPLALMAIAFCGVIALKRRNA